MVLTSAKEADDVKYEDETGLVNVLLELADGKTLQELETDVVDDDEYMTVVTFVTGAKQTVENQKQIIAISPYISRKFQR